VESNESLAGFRRGTALPERLTAQLSGSCQVSRRNLPAAPRSPPCCSVTASALPRPVPSPGGTGRLDSGAVPTRDCSPQARVSVYGPAPHGGGRIPTLCLSLSPRLSSPEAAPRRPVTRALLSRHDARLLFRTSYCSRASLAAFHEMACLRTGAGQAARPCVLGLLLRC
jgi:hypothetical protein